MQINFWPSAKATVATWPGWDLAINKLLRQDANARRRRHIYNPVTCVLTAKCGHFFTVSFYWAFYSAVQRPRATYKALFSHVITRITDRLITRNCCDAGTWIPIKKTTNPAPLLNYASLTFVSTNNSAACFAYRTRKQRFVSLFYCNILSCQI